MRFFLSAFIAVYIFLLWMTCRVTIHGQKKLPAEPHILACWHGRLLLGAPFWLKHKPRRAHMTVLSSQHNDGRMIARAARFFGFRIVFGSSTRGGAKAIRGLNHAAKNGSHIFITPDGPKGPREEAKSGVVDVAQLTKLPILPFSASANGKSINNWDRFLFIRPFTKIHVVLGDVMPAPKKGERAAVLARLNKTLTELQTQADNLLS